MKKWFATLVFLLLPFTTLSAEAKSPEVYIALGDSLAAGQTPYRAIDAGYTDLIAAELTRSHQLGYFSKSLSFPGFTTDDVVTTVQSKEAKEPLKNATLVTISAGANDLLRLVQVNPSNGSLSYQQVPADFALNSVRKNIAEIITEVKKAAPKAKIYVMGYYFAYPHIWDTQKHGVEKELNTLNAILKTQAEANGAVYVSVEEAFKLQAKELIPNPSDVHPSMEGYRQMANAFFTQYNKRMQVSPNELPKPNPLTFEEILSSQKEVEKSSVSKIDGFDGYLSLTELKPYI
ncbi:SGNH/GDSL hydrolase family protein [Bacillus sp. FJAT-22090]|uniref:SGNH/GDSL hydrolase family protein n=1 Tax=Bacillus sp. FJAT-22090 TaxID=1581038 RepID=UPI0011A73A57|nr:SGNH/GDSL hydrolase family protein [Bacillus sp. FJAT-22090]